MTADHYEAPESLFAAYYKERSGGSVLEAPCVGFVAYRVIPGTTEAFIDEIYIAPEHRMTGSGSALLNEVAEKVKALGMKHLTCSISPAARNSSQALAAAIQYGFKLHSTGVNEVFLMKEI